MGGNYICQCTHRRCCDQYNATTGVRGQQLNSKEYRRHQQDEAEAHRISLERRAREARGAALRSQHINIEEAFSRLSVLPTTPPVVPEEPKYRADRKRKTIAEISSWQEQISKLLADLESLGVPDSLPDISTRILQHKLQGCEALRSSSGEIASLLGVVERGVLRKEHSIKIVLDEACEELHELIRKIDSVESLWKLATVEAQERLEREAPYTFDSSMHYVSVLEAAPAVVQIASLMVVACHVVLGLPRRGCLWLFSMCSYVIETTFSQAGASGGIKNYFASIIHSFPKDVRASTNSFHLEGDSTVYAACPKCDATYKPIQIEGIPVYPQRCSSRLYNNRCGELIVRPKSVRNSQVLLPIKPYIVFDMPSWLSGILSRDGYEELMDNAWQRMATQGGQIDDIFQGSVVREFKGPDGRSHFSAAGPDSSTGRYLFSMGFDFFNPLRIIANGKKVSIGVIALTCLNLPIHLRYKSENIFLAAIVPGPKEPKLDSINPYLRPITEVFLLFWKGIKFTQTSLYENGRWILCALIAVICDLQAARKIAGLSPCTHTYFCSLCWCNKLEHTYDNTGLDLWRRRTNESCRSWADAFQNASSAKDAKSLYDRSGVRYSELLSLPYFDPTKHLVVDPMHNLFLGLVKEHFQNILGYLPAGSRAKQAKQDQIFDMIIEVPVTITNPLPEDMAEKRSVRRLKTYMQTPLGFSQTNKVQFDAAVKKWSSVHLSALVHVARGLKCVSETLQFDGRDSASPTARKMKKSDLASALVTWKLSSETRPSSIVNLQSGCLFKITEIEELWRDIRNMVKPSWATQVPDNISSTVAKLKSDQWRSVAVLYLPVTLIRIWTTPELGDGDQLLSELLHLTMLLCSAVSIVSSRNTSQAHADLYLQYMTQYLEGVRKAFPGYSFHPNHHMALHVGEFLPMYGPVHGWWTFPFERMIGKLQRILTNYKPGEYETTIARAWTRSSNIRAIFMKETCPPAIRYCKDMFNQLVSPQNRNEMALYLDPLKDDNQEEIDSDDTDDQREAVPIPNTIFQALRRVMPDVSVPMSAIIKTRLTHQAISYTTSAIHEGNSGILTYGSDTPWLIASILQFPRSTGLEEHWFAVQRYKTALIKNDPYAKYPHIRAKLWSNELEGSIEVIPFSAVESHFAKCCLSWEGQNVIVVVSMSKSHFL